MPSIKHTPFVYALTISIASCLVVALSDILIESKTTHYLCVAFAIFLIALLMMHLTYKKKVNEQLILLYSLINKIPPKVFNVQDINNDIKDWIDSNSGNKLDRKAMNIYRKEFLGNVSHELRTPLFVIQGYLEILIDGGINNPQINITYLHKCINAVERMTSLVEDLEGISSLEAGDLIINYAPFDIIVEIKNSFESFEIKAAAKDLNTSFSEKTPNKAIVNADKKRIRQVLDNIISNSIKYGKEGGRIEASIASFKKNWVIQINDNGIGIKKEEQSRVFERFYRTEKSRSRNEGGAGLGLSICKHIIDAHNQNINIESKENEGTSVIFTLNKG